MAIRKVTPEEELKSEVRRIAHEFATYAIWHLSLTKPSDIIAMRILLNNILADWTKNDYDCGVPDCQYCNSEITHTFRTKFRKLLGQQERGKKRV